MIVSANQPYFAPFPGFFYKACQSDVMILLDSVQFPRGTTWISRNRFKNDQGTLWITIPVWKTGLGLQRIDRVRICHEGRWHRKHLESLRTAYGNAPYLEEHAEFLEDVFSARFDRLVDLNIGIIHYLAAVFGVGTRLLRLSELGAEGRGTGLLVDACRRLGADCFLAQAPAAKYLDAGAFARAGIELRFFSYPAPVYPQLWGDFIGNLSSLDLVLNCGPKCTKIAFGRELAGERRRPVRHNGSGKDLGFP
jgi:hypothetical protein